jgi:DNA-binding beta-propeller fold protein YncE
MAGGRIVVCALLLVACGGDADPVEGGTLFVARSGTIASFDGVTGERLPLTLGDVSDPVDLQALDHEWMIVASRADGELILLDADTLAPTRLRTSRGAATRPGHVVRSPDSSQVLVLNDGDGTAATSSALFVAAHPFEPQDEVPLGAGHHSAAYAGEHVVITSAIDCTITIVPLDDPSASQTIAAPSCPHGCAEAERVYCGSDAGDVLAIDPVAASVVEISTAGRGGVATEMHPDGRHAYTLQTGPSERDGGAACTIGQLVVVDTMTDVLVAELALGYRGPGCGDTLAGTDEAAVVPAQLRFTPDGATAWIALGTDPGVADARARQVIVLDTRAAASPQQEVSIEVGEGEGSGGGVIAAGHYYAIDRASGTVTEIDLASRVTRAIDVGAEPVGIVRWPPD